MFWRREEEKEEKSCHIGSIAGSYFAVTFVVAAAAAVLFYLRANKFERNQENKNATKQKWMSTFNSNNKTEKRQRDRETGTVKIIKEENQLPIVFRKISLSMNGGGGGGGGGVGGRGGKKCDSLTRGDMTLLKKEIVSGEWDEMDELRSYRLVDDVTGSDWFSTYLFLRISIVVVVAAVIVAGGGSGIRYTMKV